MTLRRITLATTLIPFLGAATLAQTPKSPMVGVINSEIGLELNGVLDIQGAPVSIHMQDDCADVAGLCALISIRSVTVKELDIIPYDRACPIDTSELASANDNATKFRVCVKQ